MNSPSSSTHTVVVLSGVNGSGKTRYVETRPQLPSLIVRVDDYFTSDGVYKYDPKSLANAHRECFRKFIEGCQSGLRDIVVDNTNTTVEEISPYVLGGEAYGYYVRIVTLMARTSQQGLYDVLECCASRNVHGVRPHVVLAQHKRIMSRQLPTSWLHSFVPIDIECTEARTPLVAPAPQMASEQWVPKALQSSDERKR